LTLEILWACVGSQGLRQRCGLFFLFHVFEWKRTRLEQTTYMFVLYAYQRSNISS
jgi:hypothetical protein